MTEKMRDGIIKRGSVYYYVVRERGRFPAKDRLGNPKLDAEGNQLYVAVRQRWVKGAKTREATKAMRDEARDAVRKGTYTPPTGVTVDEVCGRWLTAREAEVATGDLRRVTLDGYRGDLARVRRFMGDRKVADLRRSDIEELKTHLLTKGNAKTKEPSPLGGSAVAGALDRLDAVLELAIEDRIIPANPAANVRRPSRKRKGQVAHWTPEQIGLFRDRADRDATYAAPMRLVLCGLRRSEVLGLEWPMVGLDSGAVRIAAGRVALADGTADALTAPKSEASERVVYVDDLEAGTATLLKQLWLAQGRPEAGLVVRDALGRPMRPEALSDAFDRIAREAGLPRIKMHGMRHSLATDLANDPEVSDAAAAALLGHDVATFHRIYAQRQDDAIREAARKAGERRRLAAVE